MIIKQENDYSDVRQL